MSNVRGGTRPYYYKLVSTATNAAVQTISKNASEYTFEGVEPGTYRVELYDAKNCIGIVTRYLCICLTH